MLLCGMNVIFWRGYVNPWLKFVSGEEKHLRSCAQPFVPILPGTEPDGPVGGPSGPGLGAPSSMGGGHVGRWMLVLLVVLVLLKLLAEPGSTGKHFDPGAPAVCFFRLCLESIFKG